MMIGETVLFYNTNAYGERQVFSGEVVNMEPADDNTMLHVKLESGRIIGILPEEVHNQIAEVRWMDGT